MSSGHRFRVRLATSVAALGLAVGLVAAVQGTAQAAPPPRNNSQNETVYFIHGIAATSAKSDCAEWSPAISKFRSLGWTGALQTVAYYEDDTNCTIRIHSGGVDTSLWYLGRKLAWDIYNRESRHGRSVDVVAHSMGGLIARAAIYGMSKFTKGSEASGGWPPYIYVEDVVTISTPHDGARLGAICGVVRKLQCEQMGGGSDFLDALDTLPNPQAAAGTDWTLIGTEDDRIVSEGSATGMRGAGHKVIYESDQDLGHSDLRANVDGPHYRNRYWNYYDGTWRAQNGNGASVIVTARNAAYYWRNW